MCLAWCDVVSGERVRDFLAKRKIFFIFFQFSDELFSVLSRLSSQSFEASGGGEKLSDPFGLCGGGVAHGQRIGENMVLCKNFLRKK